MTKWANTRVYPSKVHLVSFTICIWMKPHLTTECKETKDTRLTGQCWDTCRCFTTRLSLSCSSFSKSNPHLKLPKSRNCYPRATKLKPVGRSWEKSGRMDNTLRKPGIHERDSEVEYSFSLFLHFILSHSLYHPTNSFTNKLFLAWWNLKWKT